MKRRIALWTLVGSTIASAWVIFGLLTWPHYNLGQWPITAITAPSMLVSRIMHVPLSYYWFIFLNGICYALFGLATEAVRRMIPGHHSWIGDSR